MANLPLIAIAIAVIVVYTIQFYWKRRNFPPGPPVLPLIGSILSLKNKSAALIIDDLGHKYGHEKIFCFNIGIINITAVQDYDLAQEMFKMDEFNARAKILSGLVVRGDGKRMKGVGSAEGRFWVEQRRFILKSFRDFGFGKLSYDVVIKEEAQNIIDCFKKKSSEDILIDKVFNIPALNVLWRIVANKRFELDDPEINHLIEMIEEIFRSPPFLENVLGVRFPFLRFLLFTKNLKHRMESEQKLLDYFIPIIDEHLRDFDENSVTDFIDKFIAEMKKAEASRSPTEFDLFQLKVLCSDFLQAGSETTSTALCWTIMRLVLHQDVQDRCRKEIFDLVQDTRTVSLSDEDSLPYCNATIMEILRTSSVAPLPITHSCTKDTMVRGYTIPKDAMLVYNIKHMHNDEKYWKNPSVFDPERFLDEHGKLIKNPKGYLPLGIGKRICLGQRLAINEMFIFFTSLVQSLKFHLPKAHPKPDLTKFTYGNTLQPEPYYIHVEALC